MNRPGFPGGWSPEQVLGLEATVALRAAVALRELSAADNRPGGGVTEHVPGAPRRSGRRAAWTVRVLPRPRTTQTVPQNPTMDMGMEHVHAAARIDHCKHRRCEEKRHPHRTPRCLRNPFVINNLQRSRLRNSWGLRLGAVLNSPGEYPFALDCRLDAGSGGPAARREVEVGLFRRVADRASGHRWMTDAGRAPRGVPGGALVMSPGVRAGRR